MYAGVFCFGPGAYIVNWVYQIVLFSGLAFIMGAAMRFTGARGALLCSFAYLICPMLWEIIHAGWMQLPAPVEHMRYCSEEVSSVDGWQVL